MHLVEAFILQHWSVSLLKENMPEQDKRRYGFILPNWPCLLKCNSCHWVFCGVGDYFLFFFYWAFSSCILFPHNLAWSYYTVARIFLGHNQGHCFCLFCYYFSQVFLKLSEVQKIFFSSFRLWRLCSCFSVSQKMANKNSPLIIQKKNFQTQVFKSGGNFLRKL